MNKSVDSIRSIAYNEYIKSRNKQKEIQMNKFTTEQLKSALVDLYKTNELAAYQLAFDELNSRMGDDSFDSWLDEVGI